MNQECERRLVLTGSTVLAWVVLIGAWIAPVAGESPRRLGKTDGSVQLLRLAKRHNITPQRLGSRAASMVSDTGQLNVTITFDHELDEPELAAHEAAGVRFMRLPDGTIGNYGLFYPAWVSDEALVALDGDSSLEYIHSGAPLDRMEPLEESVAEIQADLQHRMPNISSAFGNQGKGVIIANFDTGIDVFHPDFFKVRTGLTYDWIDTNNNNVFQPGLDCVDLNHNQSCDDGEGVLVAYFPYQAGLYDPQKDWLVVDTNGNFERDYGPGAYTVDDDAFGEPVLMGIDANQNHVLDPGEKLTPLGESKIRAILSGDGTGSYTHAYVRGIDLIDAPIDSMGHGTSVASILVAQDAGYHRRFVGVAPDAELLIADRYGSTNNIFSMQWAKLNDADVMLWEVGAYVGQFLDGSSPLEQAITQEMTTNSTVQVIPNGNLASSGRHAVRSFSGGETVVHWFGIPDDISPASIKISVLWTAADEDALAFALKGSTDAEFTELTPVPGVTILPSDYATLQAVSTSPRGTKRFDLTLAAQSGTLAAGSIWSLRMTSSGAPAGDVHLFISDGIRPWTGGAYWTSNTTGDSTLTWPSTADVAINVGSYSVHSQGILSYFSGRGPRIDGAPALLDITAPGHFDITCAETSARASWAASRVNFGGTSAAGPHVAGAAALLLSAVPQATPEDIAQALNDSAHRDANTGPSYGESWGYGKLRVDDAYLLLAGEVCESISLGIMAPADGASGLDPQNVVYSWGDDPLAQRYHMLVGTTNPPTTLIPNLMVNTLPAGPRQPNTTYYWQVFGVSDCGYVAASEIMSYTTAGLIEPEIHVRTTADNIDVLEPSVFTFVDTEAGQAVEVSFTIENHGVESLELIGDPDAVNMFNGTDEFVVVQQPARSIAPGGSSEFVVRFAPPASGEYDASLNISNNDSDENPYRIVLRANGVAYPETLVTYNFVDAAGDIQFLDVPYETEFSYEDTLVGETSDLIFGIRNLGEGDLVLVGNPSVTLGGDVDDFEVTLQPSDTTQPPGGQGAYRIAFSPTQTGLRSVTVSIPNNDPRQPSYTYRIFGYGVDLNAQLVDCNGNGLDDVVDVNSGTSSDCNANAIPDECESDADGDGAIDACDVCPGEDDMRDSDADGVLDCRDNCPMFANQDQADTNGDGVGDLCEDADDAGQLVDCNGNGQQDHLDVAGGVSEDCDGDGQPDECQEDSDSDGVIDGCDVCPGRDDLADADCNGSADCGDNCPETSNPDQKELDIDGVGDANGEFDVDDPHDAGLCGVGTPGVFILMALSLLGTRCRRRSSLSKP